MRLLVDRRARDYGCWSESMLRSSGRREPRRTSPGRRQSSRAPVCARRFDASSSSEHRGDAAEALAAGLLAKPESRPSAAHPPDAPNPNPRRPPACTGSTGARSTRPVHPGDHDRLARAQAGALLLRSHPDFQQRYRFGSVMIGGHRCTRQVGSGGMCTIYLAESEPRATVVVLKVFNQGRQVSERFVSFDRFLQDTKSLRDSKPSDIVRILRFGGRRRSCLHRN